MGRGSVCDPFDAAAIVARVAAGETTAADAWSAVMPLRPRARSTFAQKLSRARARAGRFVAAPVETRPPGRPPARALRAPDMGGPVLVIGPNSALRVLGGPLDVEHGFKPDRARLRINVDEPEAGGHPVRRPRRVPDRRGDKMVRPIRDPSHPAERPGPRDTVL